MKQLDRTDRTIKILSVALATTLLVGTAAPAMAAALTDPRAGVSDRAAFVPRLEPVATVPPIQVAKAIAPVPGTDEAAAASAAAPKPTAKAAAPLPKPVAAPATQTRRGSTARTTTSEPGSAPAPAAGTAAQAAAPVPASSSGGIAEARAILARYVSTYPILQGTTVNFGDTRGNPQAIVYYKSGRIMINPNHTVSLERIVAHEVWHIIDWRDNGQINWGENIPPANANDFRR